MSTEGDIGIEGSWALKMKTYKGKYRTMVMTHFRKKFLMIADVSHITDGDTFEVELFDIKQKKTVFNIRPEVEERSTIINLVYSHKYAILFSVHASNQGKAFKITPDENDENKLNVTFLKKRILSYKCQPTYFITNKSGSHFIATTNKGNVFIGEAHTLDFELKLTGFGYFTDICMYTHNNNVYMYTTDLRTKAFGKVSIEEGLGNMLTEEDFIDKKAIKEGGFYFYTN
jgi:alpha-mannosidase